MGTTLTGTTPQDTYDSLIKVTDNGPLSGTAKYLSDGLGNDSILALSTSAAGIGTSVPAANLHIASASDTGIRIQGGASSLSYIDLADTASGTPAGSIAYNHITNAIVFNGGGTNTEFARITSTGNVGIGTNAPVVLLDLFKATYPVAQISSGTVTASLGIDTASNFLNLGTSTNHSVVFATNNVERLRVTNNGLTFNGDTAAANALDDYEEGTWTMGVSFGGGTTGITYGSNTGRYTKVGRIVTVSGYLSLSSKGSSTGTASLTGLPFSGGTGGVASCFLSLVTYTGTPQFVGLGSESTVRIYQLTEAGAITQLTDTNFSNTSEIYITYTFTV